MATEEKFEAAVNIIRSLPKDGPYQPSNEMMLKFYGLYKQAIEGPCTEPKPAFYEVVKGYKWQAWHSLGTMSKAEAKNCYVEELKKIVETMAYTENVANFIDALGPFYEYVDMPGKKRLNNNNTAKGDPLDSGNEGTESNSSGNNSPLPNGMNASTHNHTHHEDTTAPVVTGVEECAEPLGAHAEPLGAHAEALGAHAEPLGAHVEPLGAYAEPLGAHAEPLGAHAEPLVKGDIGVEEEEEGSQDEEEDEEEEEEEMDQQLVAAVVQKVYSDSDTDEEYSEPAESLAYLSLDPSPRSSAPTLHHTTTSTTSSTSTPVQQLNASCADEEGDSTPQATAEQEGAVTHGGGDKNHPGGLQISPGQGYRHSPGYSQFPLSVLSPSHHAQAPWGVSGGSAGGGGGGGGGGRSGRAGRVEEDVNAQLVVVLRRLQTDMENVLHRLSTLETLTLTQHHVVCRQCQGAAAGTSDTTGSGSGRAWWLFPELSPRSVFLLLLWPLILHGGFRLLPLLRFRRKRS